MGISCGGAQDGGYQPNGALAFGGTEIGSSSGIRTSNPSVNKRCALLGRKNWPPNGIERATFRSTAPEISAMSILGLGWRLREGRRRRFAFELAA